MKKIKYVFISIIILILLIMLIPQQYEEIETKYLLSGSDPLSQLYTKPYAPNPLYIQNKDPLTPTILNLYYSKEISFDKISMFFPGNTADVTSFAPTNFELSYKSGNTPWKPLDQVENHRKSHYEKSFLETKKADGIQIKVTRSFSTNTGISSLSDLKFYKLYRPGITERFSNFVSLNHRKLSFYFVYYLTFLSFLFLPGYVILSYFKINNLDKDLKIIFSPIISMLILTALSIFYLLTGFKIILSYYLLIFIISLIIFINKELYKQMLLSKGIFYTIGTSILITFCVIGKRDYMFNLPYLGTYLDNLNPIPMEGYIGYFVDNFFPWGIARLYLNRSPINSPEAQNFLLGTTVFERTPGLPLILTPILKIFGESHQVYQRFLETLVGIYFGSIYVLAKKLFSRKNALITILLILLNVQLLYIDFNAELFYKYIATYPTLIALTIFNSKINKKDLIVGGLLGLSFLIHPSTLVISATFGCIYVLKYKISKEMIKKAFPTVLIIGVLFSAWVLSPRVIKLDKFSDRKTSLYFSEALNMDENLIRVKVSNTVALFYPNPNLKQGNSTLELFSKNHRFQVLRFSIISNLTPVIFVFLVYFMVKNFKKDKVLISFIVLPLLIYWFIYLNRIDQYYNYGGAYFLLYPFVVPIALMYIVDRVLDIKDKLIQKMTIISYILFMVLNFYIISGIFRTDLSFPSLIPGFLTSIITLIFLVLSISLIFTLDKND